MLSYKSNAQSVLGGLIDKLKTVDSAVVSKIVRTVATGLVESNSTRIHNQGKDVEGNQIGQYAESTKKARKGKEVGFVNLSFTNKLSKEFNQDAVNDNTVNIGFTTKYAADLYEILENKYGKKIWGVTKEDEEIIKEEEKDILRKHFV